MRVRKKKRHPARLWILTAVLVLIVLFFEMRLKPVTASVAVIHAQSIATAVINRSVSEILAESGIQTEQLETVTYSQENTVTSVQSDTVLVNRLKNDITLRIQENLAGIQNYQANIPIGTIIGGEILSGMGPSVPLMISLSGNVYSDFASTFEQGGINQTVHKLTLNVSAEVNIIMPMNAVSTTVQTSVLIGETVIVGNVPSGMVLRGSYA